MRAVAACSTRPGSSEPRHSTRGARRGRPPAAAYFRGCPSGLIGSPGQPTSAPRPTQTVGQPPSPLFPCPAPPSLPAKSALCLTLTFRSLNLYCWPMTPVFAGPQQPLDAPLTTVPSTVLHSPLKGTIRPPVPSPSRCALSAGGVPAVCPAPWCSERYSSRAPHSVPGWGGGQLPVRQPSWVGTDDVRARPPPLLSPPPCPSPCPSPFPCPCPCHCSC